MDMGGIYGAANVIQRDRMMDDIATSTNPTHTHTHTHTHTQKHISALTHTENTGIPYSWDEASLSHIPSYTIKNSQRELLDQTHQTHFLYHRIRKQSSLRRTLAKSVFQQSFNMTNYSQSISDIGFTSHISQISVKDNNKYILL